MHDLGTVAIYGACFVAVALVLLGAGVLIAKALTGPSHWSEDEVCPEWVWSGDHWTSCHHRRPCPLHDVRRPDRGW